MTNKEPREVATSVTDRYVSKKREKRIQNVKTAGDLMMYIGSAGLLIPMIRNAKQNQNSIMGICATGAGAILSVGLGNVASKILNKTVDKVVDFWDDVNPKPVPKKTVSQEAEENG